MATELGKAYVQIIPSAKGISGSISKELGGEAESAGKSAGFNIGSAIKGAIAAAGIGTVLKNALDAGGNLQQSFGGLDTLYGDAADAAKKYAVEAAQAGISANSYAEQAVSFGAALKSAFGGDTAKAAEAANVAIMDMADNSAKMGTDIESIQTAYQGFAKGNYTMLDNLKLGFGGTKSEMERLLETASAMPEAMGKTFDINNLGDVYEAIHLIQQDLGLTGVAADEAKTTFSGSLGAMKAAGENLLASLALGEDITPALNTLGETVRNFVFGNLIPMLSNIFTALPDLLSGLGSMLIQGLNIISNNSGEIVQQGIDIVVALVEAIVSAAPYLVEAAFSLITELGRALIETDWATIGSNLITSLKDSMSLASGEIFGSDASIITAFLDSITTALPSVLDKGIEIITNIANGIFEALPSLITTAGELVTTFLGFIMQNYPVIMQKGAELLLNLVNGIVNNLPQIVTAVVQVIAKFIATIGANLPQILTQGITIIGQLIAGLLKAIPQVIAAIPAIINAIIQTFGSFDWASIGHNILEGIKNGILNAISAVVNAAYEAASAVWDAVKGFFDIGSPSKLMAYAGEMVDLGLANGIADNQKLVDRAIDSLGADAVSEFEMSPSFGDFQTQRDDRIDQVLNLLANYLPVIATGENMNIEISGDPEGIFNVVKKQNKIYKRMNGESAFA